MDEARPVGRDVADTVDVGARDEVDAALPAVLW